MKTKLVGGLANKIAKESFQNYPEFKKMYDQIFAEELKTKPLQDVHFNNCVAVWSDYAPSRFQDKLQVACELFGLTPNMTFIIVEYMSHILQEKFNKYTPIKLSEEVLPKVVKEIARRRLEYGKVC